MGSERVSWGDNFDVFKFIEETKEQMKKAPGIRYPTLEERLYEYRIAQIILAESKRNNENGQGNVSVHPDADEEELHSR